MNNEPQNDNGEERLTRQQYRQQQTSSDDERREQSFSRSRAEQKIEQEQLTSEQKMHRLRKRLNIAIVALIAAIIVVYLILFFVK